MGLVARAVVRVRKEGSVSCDLYSSRSSKHNSTGLLHLDRDLAHMALFNRNPGHGGNKGLHSLVRRSLDALCDGPDNGPVVVSA